MTYTEKELRKYGIVRTESVITELVESPANLVIEELEEFSKKHDVPLSDIEVWVDIDSRTMIQASFTRIKTDEEIEAELKAIHLEEKLEKDRANARVRARAKAAETKERNKYEELKANYQNLA